MRIIVFIISLSAFIFGADYTTSVSSLYKEGNAKVVGRLLPTVEVKVLGKVEDKTKVEFDGYIQEDSKNAIYYAPNRRILVAGITKNVDFDYKVLETLKDDGKTWKKIRVQFLTDASEFTTDEDNLYKKADAMYLENCSICHKLHDKKEFSANQWPSIVNSMLSRTGISKDDSYVLIQYLQKNAKDMPWHK